MELPTIRWCDRHDVDASLCYERGYPLAACVKGDRVVLPVDFDERMRAQGLREEILGLGDAGSFVGPAPPGSICRYVSDWQPVEEDR